MTNRKSPATKLNFFSTLFCLAFAFSSSGILAASPVRITVPSGGKGEEIQKALDQLPAEGGEVLLSAGTYVVNKPIFLRRDNQSLRGAGPKTILFLADKANCPVIVLGAAIESPARPTVNLKLSHLFIDGNRKHQDVELWRAAVDGSQLNNNGVNVWNVKDTLVENVACGHCRSGGMVTAADVRRLTVRGFTAFDSEFDGLACYQTEESVFTDLYLHDNVAAGISLDLAFNRNQISRAVLTRNDLGVFMRHSKDNLFKDVTVRGSRNHGIFIAQTAEHANDIWTFLPGTECTGNHFERLQVGDCKGRPFVVNDVSCVNNLLKTPITQPLPEAIAAVTPDLSLPSETAVR